MGLSSLQLDAFFVAVRRKSFSAAARELGITQAALTQRIKLLEEELGLRLFVRLPRGVEPTPAASRLLRYCQTRDHLERETVLAMRGKAKDGSLAGEIRIAAYSSVLRSVVLPSLAPMLREHAAVRLHARSAEMRELPALLLRGEVELSLMDHHVTHADLESVEIGVEANVVVESASWPCMPDVYLDHEPLDPTTAQFMRSQGLPSPTERSFCGEIYLLMDAVASGLGRGVVPRHLAEKDARLRVAAGFRPQSAPVVLHALRDAMLSSAARFAVAELKARAPAFLAFSSRSEPPPPAGSRRAKQQRRSP